MLGDGPRRDSVAHEGPVVPVRFLCVDQEPDAEDRCERRSRARHDPHADSDERSR